MKTQKIYLLVGILILAGFSSCSDTACVYQDERICNDPNYNGNVNEGIVDFDPAVLDDYDEKFLLEEFTGFKCTNCPDATAEANSLEEDYQDRLILNAIHCTPFFAAPDPSAEPGDPFYLDFRTDEGEAYYDFFSPPGLPDGIINRLGTENTSTISDALWAEKLAELMPENNPEVYIKINSVEVDADSTEISASVTVKPLISSADVYTINMAINEDDIHEAQKDVGNVTLYDYVHNHVFRANSNGNWGTFAYDGDLDLGSNEALAFGLTVEIGEEWNLANCNVIVYISKESNREVIQSEIYHLE